MMKPLKHRLTPAQQARRQDRMGARRTAAQQLMQAAGYAVHQSTELKRRGFWGRLKLVLLGR